MLTSTPIEWVQGRLIHRFEQEAVDRDETGLELFLGIVEAGSVTDESQPPPDPAAEQAAAWERVQQALREWERWTRAKGFNEGWEACNERWTSLLREATEARTRTDSALMHFMPTANIRQFAGDAPASRRRAADVVLDLIKRRPGIRGVEIVGAAAEEGEPLLERTVRTALYRLKLEGQIKNLESRWYAAADAPDPGHDRGDR